MGTDIHLYVERREGGEWVSADTWEPDEYSELAPKPLSVPFDAHFYGERNYDLFAILADVRNGVGFAGVPTGTGFNVIAQPRGLPTDLSPQLAHEAEAYLDHTPSWLLLSEILAFDWTQTVTKQAWCNGPNYAGWNEWARARGDGPNEYSGGVSGGGVRHVDEAQMKQLVGELVTPGMGWQARQDALKTLSYTYCPVSWPATYARRCRDFLAETVFRLLRLGKPEDVRIVFWFDS